MQAYTHRKGLIARIARFLNQRIENDMLFHIGWIEIPVKTTTSGYSFEYYS